MKYRIDYQIDFQTWMQHFREVPKPNLLQSWAYGKAKAESQGWKVQRGIIYENDTPIAMVQILFKKFLFLKIARINSGPLWLMGEPSTSQIKQVLSLIKNSWKLTRANLLLMAPNLENTPEAHKVLESLKLRKRKGFNLRSGLVDLKKEETLLRAELRSNWRSQLKSAEKKGLTFEVSHKQEDFEWLMDRYAEYQKIKSFEGTPITLLRSLYKNSTDCHQISVSFALHNGERVAAMLVAFYGPACTLLVNWLHTSGRQLNAGNYVFWNTLLSAKNKACIWWDHGGINDENADVARFKRGIPSDEYQLVGEFLNI